MLRRIAAVREQAADMFSRRKRPTILRRTAKVRQAAARMFSTCKYPTVWLRLEDLQKVAGNILSRREVHSMFLRPGEARRGSGPLSSDSRRLLPLLPLLPNLPLQLLHRGNWMKRTRKVRDSVAPSNIANGKKRAEWKLQQEWLHLGRLRRSVGRALSTSQKVAFR